MTCVFFQGVLNLELLWSLIMKISNLLKTALVSSALVVTPVALADDHEEAAEEVEDRWDSLVDGTEDALEDAQDETEDAAEDAKDEVEDAAQDAGNQVEDWCEDAKDSAGAEDTDC